ncbi:MAG: thermonuclease family protein [Planctomycetota bacterium]|nr:thermonuclease family protein [Planctomycetota bacterium]
MPLGPDRPRPGSLRRHRAAALALGLLFVLPLGRLPLSAEEVPAAATPEALIVGTFPAPVECVVDGDTVRLPAGQPSVRVLAVDCEEVLKRDQDRKAATTDFAAYARAKRGSSPRPVKYGTPAGDAARDFARELFQDAKGMRLERDEVDDRARDLYGRTLAHVIVLKPSGEVNLAEALVRAGHSPYFTKYGRSLRFDAALRAAQEEAQAAKRGIWATEGPAHYPDYAERLAWWDARAVQLAHWRTVANGEDHVTLGAADADEKLAKLVGREAVVFGLFDRELKTTTEGRRIFLLTHVRGRGFPLVFFDEAVIEKLDRPALEARYITVRGKVTLYEDRPQMVIEDPTKISTK